MLSCQVASWWLDKFTNLFHVALLTAVFVTVTSFLLSLSFASSDTEDIILLGAVTQINSRKLMILLAFLHLVVILWNNVRTICTGWTNVITAIYLYQSIRSCRKPFVATLFTLPWYCISPYCKAFHSKVSVLSRVVSNSKAKIMFDFSRNSDRT